MKIPISLIIDDPTPIISLYHYHVESRLTPDGRPLIPEYKNELLFEFCDVIERNGIKGKFSVVPMPANKGDIINGIEGVDKGDMTEWQECVKSRVAPHFSIGPEMLSHYKAVNLESGEAMELNERDWASTQDRKTLTPYIAKALSILDECGFKPTGVTSPWDFGIEVEDEYEYSISRAVKEACGKRKAWFFLRDLVGYENAKPWVALDDGECTLVSIPSTICDHTWDTIVSPRTDDEFIRSIADKLITEDGKGGDIINVLNTGGYPILISHWQCLMSNGTGVGLKVLELVAKRVNTLLSDRVRWMSFEEILDHVLENKSAFPKPHFKK